MFEFQFFALQRPKASLSAQLKPGSEPLLVIMSTKTLDALENIR